MVLFIVRHGQTEENKQKILQGHLPGTLTEQGKEQVRQAAEDLATRNIDFKCIVSSDLKRAMDSANIIAEKLHLPVVPMEILRERDWGEYTGITIKKAKEKYYHEGKWNFPGNAETDEGIFQRASKALEKLSKEYADCNIIVVTHGQFARNLLAAHEVCSYHDIPQYANAEIRLLNL